MERLPNQSAEDILEALPADPYPTEREAPAAAPRRRIITGAVAVPPELKDEDDY